MSLRQRRERCNTQKFASNTSVRPVYVCVCVCAKYFGYWRKYVLTAGTCGAVRQDDGGLHDPRGSLFSFAFRYLWCWSRLVFFGSRQRMSCHKTQASEITELLRINFFPILSRKNYSNILRYVSTDVRNLFLFFLLVRPTHAYLTCAVLIYLLKLFVNILTVSLSLMYTVRLAVSTQAAKQSNNFKRISNVFVSRIEKVCNFVPIFTRCF